MSSVLCEKAQPFADGELPAEEVSAFERHLVECAGCQTHLHEVMTLEGLVHSSAIEGRGHASVQALDRASAPVRRGPSRRTARALVGLAAAAAGVLLVLRLSGSSDPFGPLVTGPARPFPARLVQDAVDRHRPLRVMRGEERVHAPPLDLLARLEQRKDLEGLGIAYLLVGDVKQASAFLDRAPRTLSADVARAVVLMEQARWADAQALLEGILARAPRHPQALWNQGLVYQRLGRPVESAAALEAVAALGEAGWSEEAAQRARALRESLPSR